MTEYQIIFTIGCLLGFISGFLACLIVVDAQEPRDDA